MPTVSTPLSPTASRVYGVLKSLPLVVTDDDVLRNAAKELAGMAAFIRVNNQSASQKKGSITAKKELDALAKAGFTFARLLSEMHNEAYAAIRDEIGPKQLSDMKKNIVRVTKAIYQARDAYESKPDTGAPHGPPQKLVAAAITERAAPYFKHLTGINDAPSYNEARTPQAYGSFLEFLESLFKALEIDAKPNSQAKNYRKKLNAKKLVT